MRTPQNELEILRIGVARVAQSVGGQKLGNTPLDDVPFEQLLQLAKQDAGWNALCGDLVAGVEHLHREIYELTSNAYFSA